MGNELMAMKNVCKRHPDRVAFVDRRGEKLCYECAYGTKQFEKKYGKNFYRPGGPGYAGD
jgi:hypothetical protein